MWQEYIEVISIGNPSTSGLILPVSNVTLVANPYVPEGGTLIELFDGRQKFIQPTFRIEATLQYNYLREKFAPSGHATLSAVIDAFFAAGGTGEDVWFHFDRVNGWDGTKVVSAMVLDMTSEAIGAHFDNRVRTKPVTLNLVSVQSSFTKGQIDWIF